MPVLVVIASCLIVANQSDQFCSLVLQLQGAAQVHVTDLGSMRRLAGLCCAVDVPVVVVAGAVDASMQDTGLIR
jgi:hypothetical protein